MLDNRESLDSLGFILELRKETTEIVTITNILICYVQMQVFFLNSSTVISFRMSQKLRIVLAVIATFVACASSSLKVQTNLQTEGKHYVFLSFFNVINLRQRKTNNI
jgi:hypothetical protein